MTGAALYLGAVTTLGAAALIAALAALPPQPGWLVPAGLGALSGLTVLRLKSVSASFSVGDVFSFTALLVYGLEAATVTVALDALAISIRLRGSPARVAFNTAGPSLAMWCAGTVLYRLASAPLPASSLPPLALVAAAGAAAIIYFVIGSTVVATAVALHEQKSPVAVWRTHFASLWPSPATGAYAGALVAIFSAGAGLAGLFVLMPLPLLLYHSFKTSLARVEDELKHLGEMTRMHQSTIEAFATAIDAKDQVTHGHLRRVQQYSLALARELGVTDAGELKALEAAALLHDVGKIGIPEHILNKPGKLTPSEYAVMKRHVDMGVEILSAVEFPFPVVPIVASHHESWDGGGYPGGLRGEQIPLGARILSVVDCFDALTSNRPYRAAMSHADAFAILRERRGALYDPRVVDVFAALQPSLDVGSRDDEPTDAGRPSAPATAAGATAETASPHLDAMVALLGDVLPDCVCVAYGRVQGERVAAIAAAGPGADDVLGHSMPLGHGISGWVAANDATVDDTDADLDFGEAATAGDWSAKSCTSVSLRLSSAQVVVTVYGPRAEAATRLKTVRSIARMAERMSGHPPALARAS